MRFRLAAAIACSAVAVAGCHDSTSPANAPLLAIVSGNHQQGPTGLALIEPLTVSVVDGASSPLAGVTVQWSIASGGGRLSSATSETDASGRSSVIYTLGTEATATVRASVSGADGSPVTFTATQGAVAGPELVATIPIPPDYGIHDTYVRDGLAFTFIWNSGFRIYDVGNGVRGGTPSNPQLVGNLVTSAAGSNDGPNVHNGWWFHNPNNGEKRYLFLGQEGPTHGIGRDATGDIHVVDVSDLTAPREVAFYHYPAIGADSAGVHNFWMDESAQILYAAYYNGGVIALDVRGTLSGDLGNRLISKIITGGTGNTFTWGVQLANGSLYALDMLSGLHQLGASGGMLTHVSGGGNVPERFSSDLWVQGNHAYTGTWGTRGSNPGNVLKVWQLDASGAPTLVDSVKTLGIGTVSDVEVTPDGKWLMFTAESGSNAGLYLYSLADPSHPAFLGRYLVSTGLHTGTFATIGGKRYVFAARNPGSPALMVFDVSAMAP